MLYNRYQSSRAKIFWIIKQSAILLWLNQKLTLFGFRCPSCKRFRKERDVKKRRVNTNYYKDSLNFNTTCYPCFLEEEDYWKQMWDEYYSSRGV